jgi:hypothetical protein
MEKITLDEIWNIDVSAPARFSRGMTLNILSFRDGFLKISKFQCRIIVIIFEFEHCSKNLSSGNSKIYVYELFRFKNKFTYTIWFFS